MKTALIEIIYDETIIDFGIIKNDLFRNFSSIKTIKYITDYKFDYKLYIKYEH